jgi:uncharacterized protein YaaN involved in tellurite resistance
LPTGWTQNPPAVDQNDPMSGQRLQDWLTVASFARKRSDDLRRAQILADQQSAQINQMKLNSSALAQKFVDIKVTTIPAMKTTFTLYVVNMEQKKGAELSDQIDATTDAAIKKNAEAARPEHDADSYVAHPLQHLDGRAPAELRFHRQVARRGQAHPR